MDIKHSIPNRVPLASFLYGTLKKYITAAQIALKIPNFTQFFFFQCPNKKHLLLMNPAYQLG